MLSQILSMTGPWVWVILGLVLLGLEILVPSTLLLWPALAALVVGAITLITGLDSTYWPWQAQTFVFLALSVAFAWIGRRYLASRKLDESDHPNLNERGAQLIGQTALLTIPIENGQGRAKFGDSSWTVRGPDTEAGEKVRVIGNDGSVLLVESADGSTR